MTFGIVMALTALSGGFFQFGPALYPFTPQYAFQMFAKASGAVAPTILDVTNAEKLALTGITAGQQVRVSDGFVLSGAGAVNGFYVGNGFGSYIRIPSDDIGNGPSSFYGIITSGGEWELYRAPTDDTLDSAPFSGGNDVWDADWSAIPLTLTHPALQTFSGGDPSDEANWSVTP